MWWIFGGNISCQFAPWKNSLKMWHQNFTTFFTLKITMSKEICHLVLTLGTTLCNLILLQKFRYTNGRRIVIDIGDVYATFCQEEGILLQSIAIEMGGVSRHFSKASVRSRLDSPDVNNDIYYPPPNLPKTMCVLISRSECTMASQLQSIAIL